MKSWGGMPGLLSKVFKYANAQEQTSEYAINLVTADNSRTCISTKPVMNMPSTVKVTRITKAASFALRFGGSIILGIPFESGQ